MNSSARSSLRRNDRYPELKSIIAPSLQVGGLSGMSGLLFGGVAGILKSNTPILFALTSGIQWFTLGSSFWISRTIVLHAWGDRGIEKREKTFASTIAGGIGGGVSGLLRGKANVVPGIIMFSIFGAIGQTIFNITGASHNAPAFSAIRSDTLAPWLNSKWSPVKVLSDKEYESMLKEKLLKVNVDIALVDDDLTRLSSQRKS